MQLPVVLYIASILGAIALLLMLPKHRLNWTLPGAVLGAAALGGLWLFTATRFALPSLPGLPDLGGTQTTGISGAAYGFHYIFSAIAIGSAVAVITNKRPIYAALWFVMVVLASAGLFLTLLATFIAFAMVIIYGGAILVTYMFVIMLASEQQQSADLKAAPEYERFAREPLAAVAAGFLLLAVLLNVAFEPQAANPAAAAASDTQIAATLLTRRATETRGGQPLTAAQANTPGSATPPGSANTLGSFSRATDPGPDVPGSPSGETLSTPPAASLTNVERVGVDLFQSHPLGLELAGIILLVALIGAVTIAKTQVHDDNRPTTPSTP